MLLRQSQYRSLLFQPFPGRKYVYAFAVLFNLLLMKCCDNQPFIQMISLHSLSQASDFPFARAIKVKGMAHLYGFRYSKTVAHHEVAFAVSGLVVKDFFRLPTQFDIDQIL